MSFKVGKWLEFEEPELTPSGKTKIWYVYSQKEEELHPDLSIGHVAWRGSWRKYAFFPEPETVFEQGCLRDLAQFCEDQNKEHKEAKK